MGTTSKSIHYKGIWFCTRCDRHDENKCHSIASDIAILEITEADYVNRPSDNGSLWRPIVLGRKYVPQCKGLKGEYSSPYTSSVVRHYEISHGNKHYHNSTDTSHDIKWETRVFHKLLLIRHVQMCTNVDIRPHTQTLGHEYLSIQTSCLIRTQPVETGVFGELLRTARVHSLCAYAHNRCTRVMRVRA